ncbi:neurotactin [Trichogramma pretiosum]|uniref:neurotactin n=1 Tax=Trichogramma pretiosum TaxID=7493 RepID=UPI0006C9724F|nr:neurotactin [Trichogramma pretiosum]XP_014222649.1 neurotactin [Trichogramma pretiosum]XP_014222650.1 neurotactin [Trichogramma pretiosum]XP_023313438.1 neurotactin [Trichogramma pretiosum]
MSQTTDPQPAEQQPAQQQQEPQQQEANKNEDKKEIADEEREKMLNAENSKHMDGGAAPAELSTEAAEPKPKRKIPIGAIKMPGLFRSKSKEPCKDDETKPAVDADGETKDVEANNTPAKEATSFADRGRNLLQSIKVPTALTNVLSKRKKEADTELATAGLASSETLDDADAAANKEKNNVAEDGMENVRLDAEAADGSPPTKPHPFWVFVTIARRHLLYSGATLLILMLMIIIICVACVGPRRVVVQPTKDGKVYSQTSCGKIEGLIEEDAYVFRGIPYAVPPVGQRRWTKSEPLNKIEDCWNGTYLAHNSSHVCWQRNALGNINGAEDCLYLDVFTPQVSFEKPLPVVVMIGADTLSGPSPGIMVPSGKLAHVRDIVYVRPNFRLDVFGFLAAEPLSRDSRPKSSGNYGLTDIINVLNWVQLNIHYFGGDKSKVTLWGHRAGGSLVSALVGSRKASGTFQQAWISSGSAVSPTRDLIESEKENSMFLDSIQCKDADCLRSKNAEDIMEAVPPSWYASNTGLPASNQSEISKHEWLVRDGIIVQKHIGEIFSKTNNLPKVVIGATAQSGELPRSLSYNETATPEQIKRIVQESLIGLRGEADKAFAQYNATVKDLHTMISDIRVVCPLMTIALMKEDIPFYVATFPRNEVADADADAAAILGFFSSKTPEQKRHLQAIQQLFNHFVWHGEVKDFTPSKKVLIVDQDVLPQSTYDNCKLWIENTLVPTNGKKD